MKRTYNHHIREGKTGRHVINTGLLYEAEWLAAHSPWRCDSLQTLCPASHGDGPGARGAGSFSLTGCSLPPARHVSDRRGQQVRVADLPGILGAGGGTRLRSQPAADMTERTCPEHGKAIPLLHARPLSGERAAMNSEGTPSCKTIWQGDGLDRVGAGGYIQPVGHRGPANTRKHLRYFSHHPPFWLRLLFSSPVPPLLPLLFPPFHLRISDAEC